MVEHSIGNGEVDSSILSGSTIFLKEIKDFRTPLCGCLFAFCRGEAPGKHGEKSAKTTFPPVRLTIAGSGSGGTQQACLFPASERQLIPPWIYKSFRWVSVHDRFVLHIETVAADPIRRFGQIGVVGAHEQAAGRQDLRHGLDVDQVLDDALCRAETLGIAEGSSASVHHRVCAGTHSWVDALEEEVRFIPACAGNALRHQLRHPMPVHPRVCGNTSISSATFQWRGSSPRVRGTQPATSPDDRRRFIPARAGNAHPASGMMATSGSSPRVRGTRARGYGLQGVTGSSPRVRGTPRPRRNDIRGRFIPARAGNAAAVRRRHRRFIPARAGNALV